MTPRPRLASRTARALRRTFGGEAGAGVLLLCVAVLAMGIANSPLAPSWHHVLHGPLGWSPVAKLQNLHQWINDALMAVFFFVVGLEIKREVLDGELASPAQRRLPVLAAIAGMVVPALLYLAVARGNPAFTAGWAIPAATDIAFAVGVLALVGRRVPPSLRLFLLTVAIVDDLGAVAVIALFYSASIDIAWLGLGLLVLGAMGGLNRAGISRAWPYLLLAVALWYSVLHSGIHPTVAGVAAALMVPLKVDRRGDSLLLRLEHALVPWNAYLVVPLFGLANAGVALAQAGSSADPTLPLAIGVGLFLGKQAGIFGAIVVADQSGIAARPAGASWIQLWGLSLLCGIGFTMSLFIGSLAFPAAPHLVEQAKLGVMAGSLASALLGYAVLRLSARD